MAKGFKTGGRSKDIPNKLTKDIRDSLVLILNNEVEKLPTLINELPTKDRLFLLAKLLPLVIPKAITIDDNLDRCVPLFPDHKE
jgi:hypothetical protein